MGCSITKMTFTKVQAEYLSPLSCQIHLNLQGEGSKEAPQGSTTYKGLRS